MKYEILKIEKLSKSFSKIKVLRGIDISVSEGESLAIIGGSGQGKSVLLKCILGLIQPDSGTRYFQGTSLDGKHLKSFIDNIGILFQGSALFDSLPVWENISFKYKYLGSHSTEERYKLSRQKLDLVGLPSSTLDLYPSELSGGMQKRVGIARAIAANPKIVFFDEPTSGLDPIMSNTINKLIRTIINEFGATAITISHDLNSIRAIADNVALLHNGKIEWKGTIREFEKSQNLKLREFITPGSTQKK